MIRKAPKRRAIKSPDSKSAKAPPSLSTAEAKKILLRAENAVNPSINSAGVIECFAERFFGKQDTMALIFALNDEIAKIAKDDMSGPEATLYSQAAALQSIFVNLSRRAMAQELVSNYQTFMTLALKAQAQCRATLEALNEIKFPKSATFVQQANIANQQQINNGSPARVEKISTPSNKLLMEPNHGTLDTGATEPASQSHPTMETVGAVHGAKDRAREKAKRAKCH